MVFPAWLAKLRKVCSKKCSGLLLQKRSYLKNKSECLLCKKAFKKSSASKGKYCSMKCYWGNSTKRTSGYKCVDCGNKTSTKHTKRCKSCHVAWFVRDKHHQWKGGLSNNRDIHSLNNKEYVLWRNTVFTRDEWKCSIGNEDCSGSLEAHHVLRWSEYPELRFNIKNGITLCHYHHPRKRSEEVRLKPVFDRIIELRQ